MNITKVIDDVHLTLAILIADVKAHWTFCIGESGEIESGYVHLLPLTEYT